MARGRHSHQGGGGGGGGGARLACDRAIEKSDEYRQSVKKIQARATAIADLVRPDGDIAEVLGVSDTFLSSAYDRLRALAEGNARRMNEIDFFVEAVKEVKAHLQQNNDANNDAAAAAAAAAAVAGGMATTTTTPDAPNYERSIHDALENVRRMREGDPRRVPPEEHELSIEIREALGEKIKKKKRGRSSRGGGDDDDDDDDDDLEIVRNKDDVHALKCPFTGMLFENPVKNKVCGHVYDRAGLAQLLGMRKATCPVPGCSNKTLSLAQVEEDEQMKLKVKRHRAREEAEKRKRDLEEDDDDQEGGGYTVVE
jgi:hypothetical protein